jgi:hypothetical protein
MDGLMELLKRKVQESNADPQARGPLFELLSVACSQCCTDSNGGNKDCPPGKLPA